KNTTRGNRADDGRDELGLAFVIDNDLTAMLAELEGRERLEPALPGTSMDLPDKLHRDFYAILLMSQRQYQMSRVIVWTSALAVLAMLCGLAALFHRW